MGIKFGEIDSNQILLNEWRIGVLENIVDKLIKNNPNLIGITQIEMDEINKRVVSDLQKKYPKSGIELNKKVNPNG